VFSKVIIPTSLHQSLEISNWRHRKLQCTGGSRKEEDKKKQQQI